LGLGKEAAGIRGQKK